MQEKLNVVFVGAHPDDCEIHAGGTAIRYIKSGHKVTFISTTNGDAGHYQIERKTLEQRRYRETRAVADLLGIEYVVMDNHDGQLEPKIEVRQELIRILRILEPDLVFTHGLRDYHPDHRYTAQLVADTAYMLNVPLCVPEVPVTTNKNIVYCHVSYKPASDMNLVVIVPVDNYIEKKLRCVHLHASQVYEWLPWIEKTADPSDIPTDEEGRLDFLRNRYLSEWEQVCLNYLPIISDQAVKSCLRKIRYVEAFEASSWGFALTVDNVGEYFPFADSIVLP